MVYRLFIYHARLHPKERKKILSHTIWHIRKGSQLGVLKYTLNTWSWFLFLRVQYAKGKEVIRASRTSTKKMGNKDKIGWFFTVIWNTDTMRYMPFFFSFSYLNALWFFLLDVWILPLTHSYPYQVLYDQDRGINDLSCIANSDIPS